MPTINVTDRNGDQHSLEASEGTTLMEVLRDEGMGVEAICGGQCACATCHCLLEIDSYPRAGAPSEDETDLLSSLDHYDAARSRLTCQIEVEERLDGIYLVIAPEE